MKMNVFLIMAMDLVKILVPIWKEALHVDVKVCQEQFWLLMANHVKRLTFAKKTMEDAAMNV